MVTLAEVGSILSKWLGAGFAALAWVAPTFDVWQCAVAGTIGAFAMTVGFDLLGRRRRPRLAPPSRGV